MLVYFISGLGADKRAFSNIRLPDGFEAVYLEWFPPLPGEKLVHYAGRMSLLIDKSQPFVLIGLSMGGMVATEISKITFPAATILISSIPTSDRLPGIYRAAAIIHLHRWIPISWLKSAVVMKRFFMVEQLKDREQILKMLKAADPEFIRWALQAIIHWENRQKPHHPYFYIHGDKDEIFPIRYVTPTHVVPGGRHLMVLNNAERINAFLEEILLQIPGRIPGTRAPE